tara:strand:- start:509 stop:766 length:258 start_codon:yes stop_codon:yes gene_type:complete
MSMKWAVPISTMKQVDAQKAKWDRSEEERERYHRLKYCPECERVYKNADFIYKKYRNVEEEHYDKGLMPSYGLDRKICKGCKDDT